MVNRKHVIWIYSLANRTDAALFAKHLLELLDGHSDDVSSLAVDSQMTKAERVVRHAVVSLSARRRALVDRARLPPC